ncbi:DNA-directed RNA polymerase subunit RPB5 [Brazilian marseillevirus]|uniref:DNA-directed RNA polymerase subunit RPB5 n=1 Tax=Brazilian marseillevirus TaxID=1813599 RepID=UPI00078143B7|nr:DNA-directed RNA polymerase subunit RPB5 [Brazilian marseillevirus]AMQ10982.1 DNA-directed RNA polymerase subunit RPB5 [Brazilian marseillevirus]
MDYQIVRAKKAVSAMMLDRGFLPAGRLADPSESTSKDPVSWNFVHQENPEKLACVFWSLGSDSKMSFVQQVFSEAATGKLSQVVIIVEKPLVSKAKTTVNSITKIVNTTVFELSDIQFRKPSHKLIPPHRLMTEAEKKATLEKYKVELDKYPRISNLDPVTQWYGWTIGDMIEIKRAEGVLKKDRMYRVVWNSENLSE